MVRFVTADGSYRLIRQDHASVPDGMLTTTVAFEFPLDGKAARTSASLGLTALQTAVVQDCAAADMEIPKSRSASEKEGSSFLWRSTILYMYKK